MHTCSPKCLTEHDVIHVLEPAFNSVWYIYRILSWICTYAEISTWCGQSGLTSSAWRWPSWPASFTENFECVTAFSPPLGEKENTSSSFTLKVQWWYLFLLLHNQLLLINSNQCKSITLRRIGEWLSIFIDWLRQSISINRFLLIFIYNIDWNQ